MRAAPFSAIMIAAVFVLTETTVNMTDASTTQALDDVHGQVRGNHRVGADAHGAAADGVEIRPAACARKARCGQR